MAPIGTMTHFLLIFFPVLPNLDSHHIIIGGDFNLVQNRLLDRSSLKHTTLSNSAKLLESYTKQIGLSDPWRSKFPTSKVFSFFSHVHHSYSRINFFLLDNRMMHSVSSCDYHSIVISDHAPTSLDLMFPQARTYFKHWRFSSHLLSDNNFKDFLASHTKIYFEINDDVSISSNTLWEAFKACIRGQIISYVCQLRRFENSRMAEISDQLSKLDLQYSSTPSPTIYKKRLQLHSGYNLLLTHKVEKQMLSARQHFFEFG